MFALTECKLWELWVTVKWQMPAQQRRRSWLDSCSDKLGLSARRLGAISDKNAQILKILGSNIYGDYQGPSFKSNYYYH